MAGEKVLIVKTSSCTHAGRTCFRMGISHRNRPRRRRGLGQVMAWQPGIIVTDMKMPRMDGIELLNRLGELPDKQCVILLTAQGSIDRAVEAMKLGAYDFIQKPVDRPD